MSNDHHHLKTTKAVPEFSQKTGGGEAESLGNAACPNSTLAPLLTAAPSAAQDVVVQCTSYYNKKLAQAGSKLAEAESKLAEAESKLAESEAELSLADKKMANFRKIRREMEQRQTDFARAMEGELATRKALEEELETLKAKNFKFSFSAGIEDAE
ncbi:hypothetical protein JCM11491_007122 [Sporobolomyces phaffii]